MITKLGSFQVQLVIWSISIFIGAAVALIWVNVNTAVCIPTALGTLAIMICMGHSKKGRDSYDPRALPMGYLGLLILLVTLVIYWIYP